MDKGHAAQHDITTIIICGSHGTDTRGILSLCDFSQTQSTSMWRQQRVDAHTCLSAACNDTLDAPSASGAAAPGAGASTASCCWAGRNVINGESRRTCNGVSISLRRWTDLQCGFQPLQVEGKRQVQLQRLQCGEHIGCFRRRPPAAGLRRAADRGYLVLQNVV